MAKITFTLTADEAANLTRPINGQGGLQTLLRQLNAAFDPARGTIELSDAQLGRIVRHLGYGPGGFEGRLRDIFGRSLRQALETA